MRAHWRMLVAAGAAAAVLGSSGCFNPPKPWQKGELAKPAMQFGRDPLAERFGEHIASSKEAASGGYGVGGGGCGCN